MAWLPKTKPWLSHSQFGPVGQNLAADPTPINNLSPTGFFRSEDNDYPVTTGEILDCEATVHGELLVGTPPGYVEELPSGIYFNPPSTDVVGKSTTGKAYNIPFFPVGYATTDPWNDASNQDLNPSVDGFTISFVARLPSKEEFDTLQASVSEGQRWNTLSSSHSFTLISKGRVRDNSTIPTLLESPDWVVRGYFDTTTGLWRVSWQWCYKETVWPGGSNHYSGAMFDFNPSWDTASIWSDFELVGGQAYRITFTLDTDGSETEGIRSGKLFINGLETPLHFLSRFDNPGPGNYNDEDEFNSRSNYGLVIGSPLESVGLPDWLAEVSPDAGGNPYTNAGRVCCLIPFEQVLFNTVVGDIAIWDRELSDAEVLELNFNFLIMQSDDGDFDELDLEDFAEAKVVYALQSFSSEFEVVDELKKEGYVDDELSLEDSAEISFVQHTYEIESEFAVEDGAWTLSTLQLIDFFEVVSAYFGAVNPFSSEIEFEDTIAFTHAWHWESEFEIEDSFVVNGLRGFGDSIALESAFSLVLVQTQIAVADTFALLDSQQEIIRQSLADELDLDDTLTIGRVLAVLADTFGLSDEFLWQVQKTLSTASTLGFDDDFFLQYRIEIADAIEFVDSVVGKIRALLQLASTIEFEDEISSTLSVQMLISSEVALDDSLSWTIQRTLEIADTFGLVGTIRLDGEDYVVWGLNPKTLAAYELAYRKPIRGFARIAGKNLVAMEDGIFEVDGGTDDGERIPAYLRTGFVDFDDPERHFPGEKLKQLLNAYLVLSAEGETMLKVRTTRRGEVIETWFRLREKPAVVAKKQIPLSNSLRSVFFQFEIVPLKGKPASFKAIEVVPLFLSRSI